MAETALLCSEPRRARRHSLMLALLNGGVRVQGSVAVTLPALSDVSVTEWRIGHRRGYVGGAHRHSLMLALLNGGNDDDACHYGRRSGTL